MPRLMPILPKDGIDVVPDNVSEKDLKDEAHRRSAKHGYTTKYGEPPNRTKIMAAPPTNRYRENYVKIFHHD